MLTCDTLIRNANVLDGSGNASEVLDVALAGGRIYAVGTKIDFRAAVQVGGVMSVRARNLRPEAKDAVVQLLAVTFDPGEPPGGVITFAFADGGDLAAEVECVDAALADLSAPWSTKSSPEHDR